MAESGWLVDRQQGAAVEGNTPADWERIAHLVDTYADLRLGGVDASLVALAERLG